MRTIFLVIPFFFVISISCIADNSYIFYPRIWYSSFSASAKDDGWDENKSYDYDGDSLLYGATLQIIPEGSKFHSIVNVFKGSISGDHDYSGGGSFDAERFDLEYLLIHSLPKLNLIYGLRWVSFDSEFGGNVNQTNKTTTYGCEFGTSKTISLDKKARVYLNGSFRLMLGLMSGSSDYKTEQESDSWSDLIFAYDTALGFHFVINEKLSAQLRYRIFATPQSAEESLFFNGPEFSLGYNF